MNATHFFNLGVKELQGGRYTEAIVAFNKSLALKERWQSYQGLGLAYLNTEEYQHAVDAFNKSLALKEHWESYQGLGLAYLNTEEYQSGVDAFKKSLALKEHWQTYQGLGAMLFNIGQYQPAVDVLKESLVLKKHWQSYLILGQALLNIGKNTSAADAFKKSLALNENVDAYNCLGRTLLNVGKYQQAVDVFKKSLALKESWKCNQGLGLALFNIGQYQPAVDALQKSLALNENAVSLHGLGWALLNIGKYQPSVDAFKKALALNEDSKTYHGLGLALDKLGEDNEGIKAFQKYFQLSDIHPCVKTYPFLGQKGGITVSRDLIENIIQNLSKFEFAFHPSYVSEIEEDNHLQSWRNLVHIHIPKCAGTNFERPLSTLPFSLNQELHSNGLGRVLESQSMHYLWHGNLAGKCKHDVFILEAFKDQKINNIQGSFLPNHGAKHGVYCRKLLEAGIHSRKICLVRDPSQRLYSHIRDVGRASYSKSDLINRCDKELKNVMDRYIYDYDLYEGRNEFPYCHPTDYVNCESIDFLDISDGVSISRVKSSFLSATHMPNVVQFNRLNDDSNRIIDEYCLGEKDFRDVHAELILRGYLERDNQIDLEFLKKKTRKRLIFPEIIRTGVALHPITFLYPKAGSPRLILTKDFIADPLNCLSV